ncbi:hypothetical protein [Azospirillum argentinense]
MESTKDNAIYFYIYAMLKLEAKGNRWKFSYSYRGIKTSKRDVLYFEGHAEVFFISAMQTVLPSHYLP